jgi:hypothetical protein
MAASQAASCTTAATALAMSTAVAEVAVLITFVVDKVAHLEAVEVQGLPVLVHQIPEDLIQTPFTGLAEMAAEDKLDLLIL